tara:strand:+ start:52 stop:831 length:780 start_codon:yes stop_codon:yes gene_type:complete
MGKYFSVEVKPPIEVAALAGGDITTAQILFDWHGFDIPKGASRLAGITVRYTGKNGVDYTPTDFELFWAKTIAKVAPGTLGGDAGAVDTFGWFPNIIGKSYIDASTSTNDGDLVMGNILTPMTPTGGSAGHVGGANNNVGPNALILQGEPESGTNIGFDKIYVAAIAKDTHAWGASTMTVNGTMSTSSPILTVADLSPVLSGIGPGDVLRDEDGLLFGTVKSVDSATQITMENNLVAASTNDKVVYNTSPITLVLSFEK